jgi:hypothetical protein
VDRFGKTKKNNTLEIRSKQWRKEKPPLASYFVSKYIDLNFENTQMLIENINI